MLEMQDRPKLDIAITREDDKIKLVIGNSELKLIPVKEGTQRYDFLALEQFITRIAKLEYEKIVKREQVKKDLMSLAPIKAEGGNNYEN